LDLESFEKHVAFLGKLGVAPLVAGSMGEAPHLSPSERTALIKSARKALDAEGLVDMPIIAGTGMPSLRETLELSEAAARDGADYTIVIANGYFAGAFSRPALKEFFLEVAKKSPIPMMIYNFPGASGGLDLDSDIITELALASDNIVGVKLTCGAVGKFTRIADAVSQPSFASGRKNGLPFLVLGGFADFLVPSTFSNGHGAITGLANFVPASIRKMFELATLARSDLSVLPEAQRLQGIIGRADYTIAKYSIAGTKYLVEKAYGYGGVPRKPLLPLSEEVKNELWTHPHVQEVLQLEREITGKKLPVPL